MKSQVRRKLEMADRVLEFLRSNPSPEEGVKALVADLESRAARGAVLAGQERNGRMAVMAATEARKELRRGLHTRLLRHLVGVGQVTAVDVPELEAKFARTSRGLTNAGFLTAAKEMLAAARSNAELLQKHGMAEGLVGDLEKAVAEFEETAARSAAGRRDHIGARAELDLVATDVMKLVDLLDGSVRYRFGDRPDLVKVWASVRNVASRMRHRQKDAGGAAGTPPTPGGLSPAA